MSTTPPETAEPAPSGSSAHGRRPSDVARTVVVLVIAALFVVFFTFSFVGAFRSPAAHQLPFGTVGPASPLTAQVAKQISLKQTHYSNEAAARAAIDQREVYGALVVGPKTSTLLVAPAAGNSVASLLQGQFVLAEQQLALQSLPPAQRKAVQAQRTEAQKLIALAQQASASKTLNPVASQQTAPSSASPSQKLQVTAVHSLPSGDPNGVVSALTGIGLVFGGYIMATLLLSATGVAAKRWRVVLLLALAIVLGLLVDVLVGPILGGFAGSQFLVLWPIFAGIAFAVGAATGALQTLLGSLGTAIAVLAFMIIGVPASGETLAPSFLPGFWSAVGPYLPPYNAIRLITNTVYFNGNAITLPLFILSVYALLGAAVIFIAWARTEPWAISGPGAVRAAQPASKPPAAETGNGSRRKTARTAVFFALALILPLIYIFSFVGANKDPKPHHLPFGVTGSSPLTTEVAKHVSLKQMHYQTEADARAAINDRTVYGAFIAGPKTSTLIVAPGAGPSIAALLEGQYANALKQQLGAAKQAAPTPAKGAAPPQNAPFPLQIDQVHRLSKKDPVGTVALLAAIAAVIGGYVTATLLFAATREAAKRWRVGWLLLWSIVAGLLIDVMVGPILGGVDGSHFLALWPVLAGIAFAVALLTAGLQTILGPFGTLIVMVAIVMIGVPASGGTLAPLFLPGFWRTVGPYLPPYAAIDLVRSTIYFDGNGIAHALIVLSVYALFGALAVFIGWHRPARSSIEDDNDGEVMAKAGAGAAAAG